MNQYFSCSTVKGRTIVLNLKSSYGWYDFTIEIKGNTNFSRHYAGRVETGKESFTDPLMGKVI